MNKFLKTALAILPLAVMASCSDDPIPSGNGAVAEKSETRYLRVVISDAQGAPVSRAADLDASINAYQPGSEDENKIRTLDFYFYDRFKNFHSHYSLPVDAAAGDVDDDGALDPDIVSPEDNVYGIYHCNVPVELIQGETLPTYVICIVNAVSPNYYENKTMEEAQKTVLSSIYGSDHGKTEASPKDYFGMSNSVYYGEDAVTGEENALIMATPFDSNKLTTASELETLSKNLSSPDPAVVAKAENDLKAYTVNIYVERYAVKVNLHMNTTTIVDYEAVGVAGTDNATENTIKLTFNPKKWGVNAVEKSFFFLKAFRTLSASIVPDAQADEPVSDPGYGNEFETFDTMNGLLFTGWNNPDHHRCFWARTPGYYKNSYPLVADEVEIDDENPTGKYSVEYFGYNDLFDFPTDNNDVTTYTKETTMMKNRLTGELMESQYLPLSSIPSVIVAGQYSINGAFVDFYIYGKTKENKHRIFSGETTVITGTRKILDKMLDDQSVLMVLDPTTGQYVQVNSSNVSLADDEITETTGRSLFDVKHPTKEVRQTQTTATVGTASANDRLRLAADVVVLQLKGATDKFRFYNPVKGEYEAITANNINLANRLLLQNLGGAHFYKDGMAFFSAPIQHWGWYRKDNVNRFDKVRDENGVVIKDPETQATTDNRDVARPIDDWEWDKMMTGDFGLVRNHIYTMEIGLIQGLGTGIKDDNEPILPPADKVGYAVHFHVNIQKWSVLPVQSWNF